MLCWSIGNDIEKGSVLPDPPTGQSDKSDQKVDNIVAVYNRLGTDLTRQYISVYNFQAIKKA